jgi:hypothetical protein
MALKIETEGVTNRHQDQKIQDVHLVNDYLNHLRPAQAPINFKGEMVYA